MGTMELSVRISGDTPEALRDGLGNLDRMIKDLLAGGSENDSLAKKKVDLIWNRIGENPRKLLAAAASFDTGYTTEQLATKMGTSRGQVRNYAANLGRTIKSVNAALGGNAPNMPIYSWDKEQDLWVMPAAMRDAIRAKTA